MPIILASVAAKHKCPYNGFAPCLGAECMAWTFAGRSEDHCETDNLTETPDGLRPVGDPPAPDGDGWEKDGPGRSKGYHRSDKDKLPRGTEQRWVRPRELTKGFCSRSIPDHGFGW